MSRVIKFRAWHEDIKRMIVAPSDDVTLMLSDTGNMIALWCSDGIFDELPAGNLMQFTGLTDKNEKEIYEGDLLRIPSTCQYEETTYNCFEVFYHDNECIGGQNIGFCMNRMHTQGSSGGGQGYKFTPESISKHGFVVIGNIYENKDLI